MSVRFVNTTTALPVDSKLFTMFSEILHPEFRRAVESRRLFPDRGPFDVFFVNDADLDLERKNKRNRENRSGREREIVSVEDEHEDDGCDFVGVYVPPHKGSPRPVIKVSPEKVMAWCARFKRKLGVTLPLERLYPLFLVKVVIHELAHLIMDEDTGLQRDLAMPWEFAARQLEEHPERDVLRYLDRRHHWHYTTDRPPPAARTMCRFVEESLANAFVLKQGFKGKALATLKLAVKSQSDGYRHGVLWSGSLTDTLDTARKWASFKEEIARPKWAFVFLEPFLPLENVVGHLRNDKPIASANMVRHFYRHLANRVGDWQLEYENDPSVWGDRLNGTFGVYSSLGRWGSLTGIRPGDQLKFMRQRAANGSADGIDELHKRLSEIAVEKGRYQSALNSLRKRLANMPALKNNEYWEGRLKEEINESIARITSLIEAASVSAKQGSC